MAKRVHLQANSIKVSKPGIDVDWAAERDLLISLSARNAQIVQRGYLPMPSGTPVAGNPGISVYNFTIWFPWQQTKPDVRANIISNANADTSLVPNNFPPTMEFTFGNDNVQIRFVGSDGSLAGSSSYGGLIYTVFRKRLDS